MQQKNAASGATFCGEDRAICGLTRGFYHWKRLFLVCFLVACLKNLYAGVAANSTNGHDVLASLCSTTWLHNLTR